MLAPLQVILPPPGTLIGVGKALYGILVWTESWGRRVGPLEGFGRVAVWAAARPDSRRSHGATAAGPVPGPMETRSGAGAGQPSAPEVADAPGRGPGSVGVLPPRGCHTLENPEALFDPHAQSVGAEVQRFIREHGPGRRLPRDPEHHQGAAPLVPSEGLPGRYRILSFLGHEAPRGAPGSGRGLKDHMEVVPHVGMPALAADGLPQAGALQAPVTEDAHGPGDGTTAPRRSSRSQRSEIQGPGWPPGLRRQATGRAQPR